MFPCLPSAPHHNTTWADLIATPVTSPQGQLYSHTSVDPPPNMNVTFTVTDAYVYVCLCTCACVRVCVYVPHVLLTGSHVFLAGLKLKENNILLILLPPPAERWNHSCASSHPPGLGGAATRGLVHARLTLCQLSHILAPLLNSQAQGKTSYDCTPTRKPSRFGKKTMLFGVLLKLICWRVSAPCKQNPGPLGGHRILRALPHG